MSVAPTFSKVKPTMFWNKVCPFVHRSWIAAVEKNADIDLVYISLGEDYPDWYEKEVNSAGTVPCLLLPCGQVIRESNFVSQYIDENYGVKGSLQAGSSVQKHQVRMFLKALGDGVIGNMYGLLTQNEVANVEKTAEAKKVLAAGMANLEKLYAAASESGPYFLGESFGLADLTLLPFLDRFRHTLLAYREYDLFAGGAYPRLAKMLRTAESRPSFAMTAQPADFYVAVYGSLGYATTPVLNTASKGKIYSAAQSPYCQRVLMANALKGSPFEVVEIALGENGTPESYKQKVASGNVPAIELQDGTILDESVQLVHFIDEFSTSGADIATVAGNTIQPQDALSVYETRFLLSEFSESSDDVWAALGGNAEKGAAVLNNLGYLEGYYARQKTTGPYFLGEKPTLADCVVLPFWNIIEVLHEVHLSKLPAAGGKTFAQAFPRLGATLVAARAEQKFAGILAPKEAIAAYIATKKE